MPLRFDAAHLHDIQVHGQGWRELPLPEVDRLVDWKLVTRKAGEVRSTFDREGCERGFMISALLLAQ